MSEIHWFPGHMNKAFHQIEEKVKICDIFICLLDARAPRSSLNPLLFNLVKNKKKLIIFSKSDLADPNEINKWIKQYRDENSIVLIKNLQDSKSSQEIIKSISLLGQDKWAKDKKKGMKPQPLKTMVIGVPNVGKSTLINLLKKKHVAGVENKPGFTRGEQWIKLNNECNLLDTPGILPMNYDDEISVINLALIGCVKEEILPVTDLAKHLLIFLKKYYPFSLLKRFSISEITSFDEVISKICDVRKIVDKNYVEKASYLLLKEFKDGLLGKISLDR